MEGPCSSSWSDSGWIRLSPCTSHNPKEGVHHLPGKSVLCNTLASECLSWLWAVFSQVKLDQSWHIPAARWSFYKQVPPSLKVQELPASRTFLFVPQLGTCCAGARSLKARRAALHRRASLCPSWFAGVLFLAVSGEKRPYYCALEAKAGSTRRETLGPRHSFVHQRCPPHFWLTCPSTWGRRFRHSPHQSACEVFTQLHCKYLFTYCQHRSFCTLHQSQTVLIAVRGHFKDISWCVTSKGFSSSPQVLEKAA